MSLADARTYRGISEVLHFTTNTGLLGMLASGGILSRQRLPEEKYLEHVYRPNAEVRKDPAWLDYVSLSVSRINTEFFEHSSRWHRDQDVWWCIVALDPVILDHDGVTFTTTNNIYSGVRRGYGADGLEALFADRVTRWYGNVAHRPDDLAPHLTTCHQAEVLYPARVPSEYFRGIYVATGEHADIVETQSEILLPPGVDSPGSSELPVHVRPQVFEP
jgi:hypothetical protein